MANKKSKPIFEMALTILSYVGTLFVHADGSVWFRRNNRKNSFRVLATRKFGDLFLLTFPWYGTVKVVEKELSPFAAKAINALHTEFKKRSIGLNLNGQSGFIFPQNGRPIFYPNGVDEGVEPISVRRIARDFKVVFSGKEEVTIFFNLDKMALMDALDELAKAQEAAEREAKAVQEAEELAKASQVNLTVGGQTGVLQLEGGSVVFVSDDFSDTPSFVWRSVGHFRVTVGEETGCLKFGDLSQIWLDQLDNLAKGYEEIERREKARQEAEREHIALTELDVDLQNLISELDAFEGSFVGSDKPKQHRRERQNSKPRNDRDGTQDSRSKKESILEANKQQARYAAKVSELRRKAVG